MKKIDFKTFGFAHKKDILPAVITGTIFVILSLFFSYPVHAETPQDATGTQIYADDCINAAPSSSDGDMVKSSIDTRLVKFRVSGSTTYSFYTFYVSDEPGFYSYQRRSSTCATPTTAFTSGSYLNNEFYYAQLNGASFNPAVTGFPVSAMITLPYSQGQTLSPAGWAYRYTYGDLAVSPSGYIDLASNYCFDFGVNNQQERSISWNNDVRTVSYYNGTQYRTYFVRPYDSSLKYIYNSSTATCGGSESSASISRITYNGVQYSLWYSSYSGPPHYPFYKVTAFDNNDAIEYTGGASAHYLYSLPAEIDYSNVEKIYPTKNNYDIASFATAANGNYDQIPDSQYLGLYFTRYDKTLDALYSYRLILEDTVNYPISYSLSNDILSVTFNDNIFTSIMGITSIYDKDGFNFYSTTNRLSQPSSYLNSDNGNTYNIAYPDITNADQVSHAITTIFTNTNSRYVYSQFAIPQTLNFNVVSTNYDSLVEGKKIKFFRTSVDSEDYYDYYVILNFRSDAFSGVLSDFYNNGNTYTLVDDSKVLNASYYSIIPYLNQKMMFENYKSDNTVQDVDDYINGTVDTSVVPQFDPDYVDKNINFTEEEYITVPAVDAFDRLFQSLTELATSATVDNQTLLNLINSNTNYFFNCLRDFENPNLTTSSNFISEQLDGVYDNTILSVPINIALVSSVIWAVIF